MNDLINRRDKTGKPLHFWYMKLSQYVGWVLDAAFNQSDDHVISYLKQVRVTVDLIIGIYEGTD